MFFRHNHDHSHFGGRGPFGRHGFGGRGRGGGGHGPREGRMFDSGELRLVILALLAEKPRHGYDIIRELGERVGNDYSPSPGVIYPTLTMLEDMGFATPTADAGGRKLYALTPEGEKALAESKPQVEAIFERLKGDNEDRPAGIATIIRAMINLRAATKLRLRGRNATEAQIQAIVDVLDSAAKTIEKI